MRCKYCYRFPFMPLVRLNPIDEPGTFEDLSEGIIHRGFFWCWEHRKFWSHEAEIMRVEDREQEALSQVDALYEAFQTERML